MSDLKRCPFCGGNPRTEVEVAQKGDEEDYIDFSIRCVECGVAKTTRLTIRGFVNFMDVYKAEEQVTWAWNKRI